MEFTLTITGHNEYELATLLSKFGTAQPLVVAETPGTVEQVETAAPVAKKSKTPKADVVPVIAPAKPELTIVDVRAIASTKSQGGQREQVKALITKYGYENLAAIDPKDFEAFINDVNAL
jgi:hypothetical protein